MFNSQNINKQQLEDAPILTLRKKKRHNSNNKIKLIRNLILPPAIKQPRKTKYNFEAMQEGDALEVSYSPRARVNILTAAKIWAKRKENGATFTTIRAGNKLYLKRVS